jgi:TolB-like protein/DNA-binding winged helix-turn-helix (wHTH) protein/Flp pilus assembly protein TadD
MALQPTHRTSRQFGPFSLDAQTGELTRNGLRVRLQPQPARMLILLTDTPGALVTREEIRRQVWGTDTLTDLEQSINFAIRQIRAALRDAPDNPTYLETISKRGYRFIAPVSETVVEDKRDPSNRDTKDASTTRDVAQKNSEGTLPISFPSPMASPSALSSPARKQTRLIQTVFLLGSFAGICLLLVFLFVRYKKRVAVARDDSIAVLPFVNLTGDPSLEYLSDGMTEEMITRLAKLDPAHLKVIARTSAMSYKDTHKTAQQIGQDLNVQYLMEGSLQKRDNQVRVIAQLIRVSDQMHIWAQPYDGQLDQLVTFENQITRSVANSLALHLSAASMEGHIPVGSQAHNDYLQGIYALSQRSKQDFERAMQSFSYAIQEDPQYADAYAQLAVTYNLMGQYNWMRQDEARSQAKAAALQALTLDDTSGEAHAALGFSEWFYDWNSIDAEKQMLRAIELEPNNVDAHHWYSQLLMTEGRLDESERQMHAALALDPNSLILRTNLGWIHYTARNYPLAIEEIKLVVTQNPGFLTAHYKLWWIYSVIHDEPHAWQEFQIVARSISSPEQGAKVLSAYKTTRYAGALLTLAGAGDSNYYGNRVDAARCMIFAGNSADALRELGIGLKQHDGWMIFVPTDPAFDPLHSDPSYLLIVKNLRNNSKQTTRVQ